MCKNAAHHQHSIRVRRILCNHKQTVQQVAKQQQYKKRAKYSKLLADDREDHIVLCFRNCCNLLRTVAKSFSEKSTGANRIKSLQNLIAASGKPFIDTVRPEVTAYSFKDLQIIFKMIIAKTPITAAPGITRA